jgi:hypothetical protein
MDSITSLRQAFQFHEQTLKQHPNCDADAAFAAALAGRRRPYPVLRLSPNGHYPIEPGLLEPEFELPEVAMPPSPEADLAREVIGLLEPIKLLNPVSSSLGMPGGVRMLLTSFGLPLDPLDIRGGEVVYNRTAAELLAGGMPDPAASGMLPELRRRIALIAEHAPPSFAIELPDMQGPFNLMHAILGDQAMYLPREEPEQWHALMESFTRFWIQVWDNLVSWVGPRHLGQARHFVRIAECDVNLVSPDFYSRFILPYDQMIAAASGGRGLHIHPCSGRHVFRSTIEQLPNVTMTEAGLLIETKVAAAQISVDEAQSIIGDRPVLLSIGQELPNQGEFEFVTRDLDRAKLNNRLLFGYTGMHWRSTDRPLIRELHRRLDAHWRDNVLTSPAPAG